MFQSRNCGLYLYGLGTSPARRQLIGFFNAIGRKVPAGRDIQVVLDIMRAQARQGASMAGPSYPAYLILPRPPNLVDRRRSQVRNGRMTRIDTARRTRSLEMKPGGDELKVPYQIPRQIVRHIAMWMRQDADSTSLA